MERPRIEPWLLPALALTTLALYGPALGVSFAHDDVLFLSRAAGLEPWPDPWHRALSQRGYFALGWRLFGPNPLPFHAVALALHTANAYLLYRIALRLRLPARAGVCAALLFVASPAAFTPLHWISATQELLVSLFALLATLAALRGGLRGQVAALGLGAAALFCKESVALLLPALAVALPLERRERWLLGAGGLALAAALLPRLPIGGGEPLPPTHPYQTAFGANLLWSALTYSAWSAAWLDPLADRLAAPQPALALRGLLVPGLLAAAAVLRPAWRVPILRAVLVAIALLAPVLPLREHAYLYYLYLPLAPLWLLAGAGLLRVPSPHRWLAGLAVALFVALGAWRSAERRGEVEGGLPADPTLRWAQVLENASSSLAEAGALRGEVLILTPAPPGDALAPVPAQYALRHALAGGLALRLLHPEITSVAIRRSPGGAASARDAHVFLAGRAGRLRYLGSGEAGRHAYEQLRAGLRSKPDAAPPRRRAR